MFFYFDFLQALQRLSVSACNESMTCIFCTGNFLWHSTDALPLLEGAGCLFCGLKLLLFLRGSCTVQVASTSIPVLLGLLASGLGGATDVTSVLPLLDLRCVSQSLLLLLPKSVPNLASPGLFCVPSQSFHIGPILGAKVCHQYYS